MAYCEIFKKEYRLFRQYLKMEQELALLPNVLVIYLTASTDELINRCKKTNHEVPRY